MNYEPRLRWPADQPRNDTPERSRFGDHDLFKLLAAIETEVCRLGGSEVTLSSELPIGRAGRPISGWRVGDDHGVVVYWTQAAQSYCMAIDRYDHPLDNLRAVQLSLEAFRALARWGGDRIVAQALSSFTALPPPPQLWHEILGLGPGASLWEAEDAYRRLIRTAHPDAGGSTDLAAALNRAIAEARQVFTRPGDPAPKPGRP